MPALFHEAMQATAHCRFASFAGTDLSTLDGAIALIVSGRLWRASFDVVIVVATYKLTPCYARTAPRSPTSECVGIEIAISVGH